MDNARDTIYVCMTIFVLLYLLVMEYLVSCIASLEKSLENKINDETQCFSFLLFCRTLSYNDQEFGAIDAFLQVPFFGGKHCIFLQMCFIYHNSILKTRG